MSFKFDWTTFKTSDFPSALKQKLNGLLEESVKQKSENDTGGVSGSLVKLDFGTEEPDLTLDEVHELTNDEISLTFSFCYEGNASCSFQLNTQVNPLVSEKKVGARARTHLGVLLAHKPLRIDLFVAMSEFRLEGKVTLSYNKNAGFMTMAVANECLRSVKVNSSMDGTGAGPQVVQKVTEKVNEAFTKLAASPLRIPMPQPKT